MGLHPKPGFRLEDPALAQGIQLNDEGPTLNGCAGVRLGLLRQVLAAAVYIADVK